MRAHSTAGPTAASGRGGFTLAELILATGLAALVMGAMVSIVSSALNIWTKGETSRQAREASAAVASLMAHDIRQLHGSPEGDLVVDWDPHDVERDGTIERFWPRLRFVRDASAREAAWIGRRALAEVARLQRDAKRIAAGDDAGAVEEILTEEDMLEAAGVTRSAMALGEGAGQDAGASALLEILYAVVPEGDKGDLRYSGILYRSERVHTAGSPPVLMRDDAFDQRGMPDMTLAREVLRGVLWMRPLLATQTTHVLPALEPDDPKPWTTGRNSPLDAATSWDAWRRGRPDAGTTSWNEPGAGMPGAKDRPLLPRRIRLELEIQRKSDRERAPKLIEEIDSAATSFEVTSGRRLGPVVGRHVMVGGEWMRIVSVRDDTVNVQRSMRLTKAMGHPSGTGLLFGTPVIVDLPVAMYEDDWQLGRKGGEGQ